MNATTRGKTKLIGHAPLSREVPFVAHLAHAHIATSSGASRGDVHARIRWAVTAWPKRDVECTVYGRTSCNVHTTRVQLLRCNLRWLHSRSGQVPLRIQVLARISASPACFTRLQSSAQTLPICHS